MWWLSAVRWVIVVEMEVGAVKFHGDGGGSGRRWREEEEEGS